MSRLTLLLALASSGCFMAGNYHSARTLEKGTGSVGLTFSVTRYTDVDVDETTGERTEESIVLPSWLPEFTYHIGVTDDVEVGGRVAPGSLGLEGDLKFRFLHTDMLHLAIAPSIGYQGAILYDATHLRLPLIATIDLAENFGVTGGAFAGTTRYRDAEEEFTNFEGTLAETGAFLKPAT